jgi:putative OPT family oligopeptide transporter
VFSINTSAALLGMGYIVGLKYAAIICAGSVAVWWIIVPAISLIFPDMTIVEATPDAAAITAANASPEQFFGYAKSIGIGGIAMAGIIGVIKSWGVIKSAFTLVGKIFKGNSEAEDAPRTQRDLSMKIIAIGSLLTIIVTTLFFYFDVMGGNLLFTIVGILIVAIIAFLFTTVAANAIAIVGSNPVSGMTLMTLILSSIIMVVVGLKGTGGMVAALIMGGVVCTALSSAGAFITDLKIGYWLGATPKKQETFKFLGILVSAATVGGVIMILNKAYGFTPDNSDVMAAPQARAMAAVIEPLMSGQGAPWLLYGIGAVISIVLTMCGVSALAFALGMFIPLQLNLPLIVGGLVNWYVNSRSTNVTLNQRRNEKGTLLASGFIAGGALMGVVSAGMQFGGLNFANAAYLSSPISQVVSLIAYVALIIYLAKASLKA